MAIDDIRLDHCLQIQLLPVFGRFSQHGVQINGVGHYFAGRFRPLSENPCQDNHWLSGDIVMNSGDDGVILGQLRIRNLPLKGPESWLCALSIDQLTNLVVGFKPERWHTCRWQGGSRWWKPQWR